MADPTLGAGERGFHLLGPEWDRAQTNARRIEDGVTQRCSDWRRGGLARAQQWQLRMINERDFDRRKLGEAQNRIAHPIHAGDARAVELHLFVERAAERLHDQYLHLVS